MAGTPPVGVVFVGGPETKQAFRHMADDLGNLTATHRAAAELAAARSRDLVPVDSGALRDSIRVEADQDGAQVLAGDDLVPYAGVIEFGWPGRNIEAVGYLGDPLETDADAIAGAYDDRVGELVERFGRETPG